MPIREGTRLTCGVADANLLRIGTEKGRLLAALNMSDSAAAIRAVVHCVREHQNQVAPPGEQQAQAT